MALHDSGNCYCGETSTSDLLQKLRKQYCPCLCEGLVAAVLGDKYYWWIDPAGAILLAIYTITNAVSLVGKSASTEILQKLTYLVTRHPQVERVGAFRACSFGVFYFVEVDIELPEELPLKEAHTIGETLQSKIKKLPEVERAFVHLDDGCEHKLERSVLNRLPNR
ncbi:PREDICTED: metal tolerance protein 4-like [Populus euphratica]|uniref:Metal tolerance protein 4-like n=1 Tax=Populus euphratica TaxID=75702 RepID=A0AAJ6UYI4_POPEU|nr:PREDICTED: metal tolerance protein 4-like [Populus euphratica]